MLELPYYVKTVLKHCLVASVLLMLVAQCQGGTVASNPTAVTGNDIRATLNNAVIEDRSNKRPGWWPLVQCIFLADINKCLQDRTVRGLMGIEGKDIQIDANKGTVKVPGEPEEGIFEVIGDLMSDGISRFFQDDEKAEEDEDDDDDDDEDENNDTVKSADISDGNKVGSASSRTNSLMEKGNRSVETGRGKKKKKKKEKKRALIKLILLVLLIKLKIAKFLYFVGKLMEFKFVAFVGINTLINVIRFIMEWRKKKDDGKIYYSYEQAHHQHHYDEHHHGDPYSYDHQDDDKGWLNGIWNRRGLVGSGDQPVDLTYNQAQKPANRDYAQDLAYGAHNPTYNGQLNVGEKKIN